MSLSSSRGRRARYARGFAALYLIALVTLVLAMRLVGERHWLSTILLYLPRLGFALPLPFVVGLCLVSDERRVALGVLSLALLVILFPLMGLSIHGRSEQARPSLRVMSWNSYFGRLDNEAIFQQFLAEDPDLFVGQATAHRTKELFRAQPRGYQLHSDDEFFLATRYPVVDKFVAPRLADDDKHHGGFVRYTLETPLGLIDLINVHPRSPRNGLDSLRGRGLKTRVLSGDLPDEAAQPVADNTLLRSRQVEAAMTELGRCAHPVIIAGDTNLPTQSWLFHQSFGRLADGFDVAGRGFGYTFPAKRPWMRIDRVLADQRLRFLGFHTGKVIASDHLYVVGELGLAR